MAVVPNKNGVPISPVTPLVDPHNPSKWEKTFLSDGLKHSITIELSEGINQILSAEALRSVVQVMNPQGNSNIKVAISAMASANDGIDVFAANGYRFTGVSAGQAFYVYSPEDQKIVVLTS